MDNIYEIVDQISDKVSKKALSDRLRQEELEEYLRKLAERHSREAKLEARVSQETFDREYTSVFTDIRYHNSPGFYISTINMIGCPDLAVILRFKKVHNSYFLREREYGMSPFDIQAHSDLYLQLTKEKLLSTTVYDCGSPKLRSILAAMPVIPYRVDNLPKSINCVEWFLTYVKSDGRPHV
jgi:hypothetical protein